MAEFKIDGRMTVRKLKENFKNEFMGTLRVYDGRELADDKAYLAAIRKGDAKGGELVCRASRTVGKFIKEMKEIFGIRVQVATPDDYVLVLDGITLNNLKNIKAKATKEDMEELVAYKRTNTNSSAPSSAEQPSVKKKFRINLVTKGSKIFEIAPVDKEKAEIEDMSFEEIEDYMLFDLDASTEYEHYNFNEDTEDYYFELKVYNESDEVVYESNELTDFKFYGCVEDIYDEDDYDTNVELQNFAKEFANKYNEGIKKFEPGLYLSKIRELGRIEGDYFVEDYEFNADKLFFVLNSALKGLGEFTSHRHMYYDYKLLEFDDWDLDYNEYGRDIYTIEKLEDGEWDKDYWFDPND